MGFTCGLNPALKLVGPNAPIPVKAGTKEPSCGWDDAKPGGGTPHWRVPLRA